MNKKEILMQPNRLIRSKYDFTTVENKLFYKMLFNAQRQGVNSKLYSTEITKDELKEFLFNKNDYQSKNIKDILNLFQQSVLEFDYIDDKTSSLKTFSSGLITSYTLDHEQQVYTIDIHEILYEHITDFIKMQQPGNGYTPINLSLLFNFRGAYTQRLYTFLRSWSREGVEVEVQYELKELREYLKLKPDIYPEYKYFKQNVLKRAIKEINEKGNMKVEIKKETRKNRKIHEIIFSVIDYETRKYFDINSDKEKFNNIYNSKEIKYLNENKKQDIVEFYIPNRKLFTDKTLKLFINDFIHYDFKESKLKNKFYESIGSTLEKDDAEKIYLKSYNYFKKTLENKLNNLEKNTEFKNEYQKTKFHNFDETFTKYTEEEFEELVLKSQKKKFK